MCAYTNLLFVIILLATSVQNVVPPTICATTCLWLYIAGPHHTCASGMLEVQSRYAATRCAQGHHWFTRGTLPVRSRYGPTARVCIVECGRGLLALRSMFGPVHWRYAGGTLAVRSKFAWGLLQVHSKFARVTALLWCSSLTFCWPVLYQQKLCVIIVGCLENCCLKFSEVKAHTWIHEEMWK